MELTCSKNSSHTKFIAKQRIIQEIEMDSEGNYQATYNDQEVLETLYDEATCGTCGAEAVDVE